MNEFDGLNQFRRFRCIGLRHQYGTFVRRLVLCHLGAVTAKGSQRVSDRVLNRLERHLNAEITSIHHASFEPRDSKSACYLTPIVPISP
jgi:hypothetical protein